MKAQSILLSNSGDEKKSKPTENQEAEKEIELLPRKHDAFTNTKRKTPELKANRFNLTKKEIAVLGSLSKGHSYKMIAADCNIATNTVREHIRHIYHKLNVHSCLEAVLLALQRQLFLHLFSSCLFA